MNYYERLGVAEDASRDDIKQAYRRLARRWHPDRNLETDTTAEYQEIGEAYDCLSDPEKREQYDLAGCPENSEEATRHEAATARVIQSFTAMMSQRISPETNYRRGVIDSLASQLQSCQHSIETIQAKEASAKAVLATFPDKPGNRVLRESMQGMIDNATAMVAGQNQEIALLELALEIAREIEQKPLNQAPVTSRYNPMPFFDVKTGAC